MRAFRFLLLPVLLAFVSCATPQPAARLEWSRLDAAGRYALLARARADLDAAPLGGGDRFAAVRALERRMPGFSRRFEKAHHPELLACWAHSSPIDANAHGEILPEATRARLGMTTAYLSETRPFVHAGLMHSYGYLFSTLQTPYGLKGKRWVESRIDERLGLAAGTLAPVPVEGGEFLHNLTWLLYHLTGDWEAIPPALQGRIAGEISPSLGRKEDFPRPEGVVEEKVAYENGEHLVVRTHFFPLAPLADYETRDASLLVYSVVYPGSEIPRLVTAFPVDAGFVARVLDPNAPAVEFVSRYNLVLDPAVVPPGTWPSSYERNVARP